MASSLSSKLSDTPRLLLEAKLKPLQGDRFQATGFADLGPARYQHSDGKTEMILVESAQSVANRLESVCWDEGSDGIIPELDGMPYILVKRPGGGILTNSILEAHRINSPYVLNGTDQKVFEILKREVSGMEEGPVDLKRLAGTIFRYDPNTVLHGVFLARKELAGGRLRMPRLLSGFIEARDVRIAESGGVKNDRVNPSGDTKEGFGNVPFHRSEFTAGSITAYFNLDLAQLRGYGLGADANEFLLILALFKIQRFLARGLRLRSACDLEVIDDIIVTRPTGFAIPDETSLAKALKSSLAACTREKQFATPSITDVTWVPKPKSAGKKKDAESRAEDVESEDDGED